MKVLNFIFKQTALKIRYHHKFWSKYVCDDLLSSACWAAQCEDCISALMMAFSTSIGYWMKITSDALCQNLVKLCSPINLFKIFQIFNMWRQKRIEENISNSFTHFMCAIPSAHTSTCTFSFMYVKHSMHHFCLWHLLSGTLKWRKWKERSEISKLIVYHFSLIVVKISLAWILYFHVWLQNKEKIVSFVVNTITNLAYLKHFRVLLSEP